MGLVKEFKEFAMRGNVIDMAVGIVIGVAFGSIVQSFVADVIMPPIGILTGGVDFSAHKLVLQAANEAEGIAEVTVNWGAFLNSIIQFIIIAFAIFLVIKAMNAAKKKEEEKPAAPPEPPAEEKLLTEIRDLLKAQS